MIYTPLFISILAFMAIVLFSLGIYVYLDSRKEHREVIERVKRVLEESPPEEAPSPFPTSGSMVKEHSLNIFKFLGGLVKPKGEGELSHLRKTFLKAGLRGENTPVIFFGVKAFLAILLPLALFLFNLLTRVALPSIHFMFLSILLALIGFYLPSLWLRLKIDRRKQEILKGFPDALDLMVVCVEAGVGLDAAIQRVGEEMKLSNKILSEEFKILSLELRAGKLRQDALRSLAFRTDLEDVKSLVTLLIQTDKFGTSVAQALRVHSDSMRTNRRQKAEMVAAKLPVKLVFPLILFIFPSLFVAVLGPAVIRILRVLFPALTGQ
jgi:tight adherence protein C